MVWCLLDIQYGVPFHILRAHYEVISLLIKTLEENKQVDVIQTSVVAVMHAF